MAVGAAGKKASVSEAPQIDVAMLEKLSLCESGASARRLLERAILESSETSFDEGAGGRQEEAQRRQPLYNSLSIPKGASTMSISDADLAIQTKIRNGKYSVMELIELNGDRDADRATLSVVCLTVASMLSSIAANQSLPGPEILRFLVVWVLSFAPLAFVGYGIATPSELQGLLVSIQRNLFPSYRARMIQHEAGHFLLGYLLGLPIKAYSANAMKNAVEFYPLSDSDVGRERARQLGFDVVETFEAEPQQEYTEGSGSAADTGYFSEAGRGGEWVKTQSVFRKRKNYRDNPFLKLPSQDEPRSSWPFRGFDDDTLDKLAVISVGGVAAELLAFGNAEGGYADFSQLWQILNSSENQELSEKDMDNMIRFSLGYSMCQLRLHVGALDVLAETMARDGTVAECVQAIEMCDYVSGSTVLGDGGERERRERFRSQGVGLIERILLGGKNSDAEDTSVIEGKGGGDRREGFQLSGDDPFYAALATAFVFLAWALNGGLSLH